MEDKQLRTIFIVVENLNIMLIITTTTTTTTIIYLFIYWGAGGGRAEACMVRCCCIINCKINEMQPSLNCMLIMAVKGHCLHDSSLSFKS